MLRRILHLLSERNVKAACRTPLLRGVSRALAFAGSFCFTVGFAPVLEAQNPASFHLREQFGVSWPEQPIEFRYDGGVPSADTRMIGPSGVEVPFQWVSSCSDSSAVNGCIAIRSALPANADYTWTLQSDAAPSAIPNNPVQLNLVDSNYEITNGLTGVRIATQSASPGPSNLAPIQGILLPSGVWTASASPNLLYTEPIGLLGCVGCLLQTPMNSITSYSVTVVDSGPLKVVLKASYTTIRPRYVYGSVGINAPGSGHYTFVVTMYANSKSILIDEDSDTQFAYYLPLFKELQPDLARYRGHDAIDAGGSSNPLCGYENPLSVSNASNSTPVVITADPGVSNGQRVAISGITGNSAANGTYYAKTSGYPIGQFGLFLDAALTKPIASSGDYTGRGVVKPAYRGQNITPAADAWLDLTYTQDRPASYRCEPNSYRKLLADYTAATHSAGWYVELFNSTAGPSAPLVGIYTGRASQQVFSATGPSLPGIYTSNRHWLSGVQDAGIQVENLLRGPDNSTALAVHRNWGIFVSSQADLLAANAHQPIADEQNSLTGINLSRLYTYSLSYDDPPGGWTWLYLPAASANQLVSWVRDGTAVCGSRNCYFTLLKNSESSAYGTALLNMWQGNSAAAVQTALNGAIRLAGNIVRTLTVGDNHFDSTLGYYQLGLSTSPATAVLNAVLMDSNATPDQRTAAKAALALFGSIFWDNDWFPIDNTSGESVGLANQIQQYLEYRTQSATSGATQPFLASKLTQALSYPASGFSAYFSSTGAAAGSTHYQSAFFEPLVLNYQSLAANGLISMADPKWAAYANWELSIQTPPEPRFGNLRKGYSNGDGNTEADVRTGMLATALYASDPTLAGNLMWAWKQSNSATRLTEDSQFTTTLAAIDPTIAAVKPRLGSINVPGYHAAERHGFGTPNETAVWFIDGSFYSTGGHRHYDDGQVSIYAQSAPLAIDWNANLYSPETPGRFMHNSVVFDAELGHPWNSDNASLTDVSSLLHNPVNREFAAFSGSTHASADFTTQDGTVWTRSVRTMAFNPAYPVIYVKDTFRGPGAGAGKTLTWNLMATGPVSTPSGPVTPEIRFSTGCQTVAGQLPSAGNVVSLSSGIGQFTFTGARWPKHATGGIDSDLFVVPTGGNAQFLIGNWGHGCQAAREAGEYATANGAPFAEAQHILRVHDTGPFTTLILPYVKTARPDRTVTQQECGYQIVQNTQAAAETTCFNDSVALYTNGITSILSVYDDTAQSAFGVSVRGGSQEITVQSGIVTWIISGSQAGTRTLAMPGLWNCNGLQEEPGSIFTYNFSGGAQTAPVTFVCGKTHVSAHHRPG
jgi:hypothetical protein